MAGSFQREFLPGRKEPVGRLPRTVPHANDSSLIVTLERPDRRGRIIQDGIPSLLGYSARQYDFRAVRLTSATQRGLASSRPAPHVLLHKRAGRSAMGKSSKTRFVGLDVHKDRCG